MMTSNQKVSEVFRLNVRQNLMLLLYLYDAEKYSEDDRFTKLQVLWLVYRFRETGPVEDCQHINSVNFKET